MREVLSKRTIVLLVIILGLILFGIVIYILKFKPNPERILVEGKPVEIGSCPLHPEQTKVEATARWEPNPYEPELYMEITLVELDVNDTYCFQSISLNPHPGKEPYEETTVEAFAVFGGCDRMSEGDVIRVTFHQFSGDFQLRNGNRIDVVLPSFVLKEKVVEGVSFWIDHLYVGEIEFSVEVQGETPPEYSS